MAEKINNVYFFRKAGGGGGTSDAVQYIPQELTAEQQAQARTNIGAGTSNFAGNPVLVTEQSLTEAQQMQARKNQGLYYEEEGIGEKTVTTPHSIDAQWPYPDENAIPYDDNNFRRMTDDAPIQADIVEMMLSRGTTVAGSDLQSFDITDFPSTVKGYSAIPFVSSREMFIVVSEDTIVNGDTYKKGIYVPYIESFARPYVSEITYNGAITTVHQIPAKYLPDTPSGGGVMFTITREYDSVLDEVTFTVPAGTFARVAAALGQSPITAFLVGGDDQIKQSNLIRGDSDASYGWIECTFGRTYADPQQDYRLVFVHEVFSIGSDDSVEQTMGNNI